MDSKQPNTFKDDLIRCINRYAGESSMKPYYRIEFTHDGTIVVFHVEVEYEHPVINFHEQIDMQIKPYPLGLGSGFYTSTENNLKYLSTYSINNTSGRGALNLEKIKNKYSRLYYLIDKLIGNCYTLKKGTLEINNPSLYYTLEEFKGCFRYKLDAYESMVNELSWRCYSHGTVYEELLFYIIFYTPYTHFEFVQDNLLKICKTLNQSTISCSIERLWDKVKNNDMSFFSKVIQSKYPNGDIQAKYY